MMQCSTQMNNKRNSVVGYGAIVDDKQRPRRSCSTSDEFSCFIFRKQSFAKHTGRAIIVSVAIAIILVSSILVYDFTSLSLPSILPSVILNQFSTSKPEIQTSSQERTYKTKYDIYFSKHGTLPPPPTIHAVLSRSSKLSSRQDMQYHLQNKINHEEKFLIIGDIHGCYHELRSLLSLANSTMFSAIISAGDISTKGPYSLDVIRHIRSQSNFYAVRGNRDEDALTAALCVDDYQGPLSEMDYSWTQNLSDDEVAWLAELPYTITIPFQQGLGDVVVVHGGFLPGVPIEEQDLQTMVNLKDIALVGNHWVDANKHNITDGHKPWASIWNDPKTMVVFGHDARKGLQSYYPNAVGIDTGACYGRELTGLIIPDFVFVSVAAEEAYVSPPW